MPNVCFCALVATSNVTILVADGACRVLYKVFSVGTFCVLPAWTVILVFILVAVVVLYEGEAVHALMYCFRVAIADSILFR